MFVVLAVCAVASAGLAAEPRDGATLLSAEQARAAGLALAIVQRSDLAPGLVEIRAVQPSGGAAAGRRELLAVAPGAAAVAVADRVGLDPAVLTVARADGSQLRLDLAGVVAATFATDASWLAVADGLGRLWQIDARSGNARLVSPGPFIGPLHASNSDELLALAVPSVEAPWASRLVRVDLASGAWAAISDEPLVYGATPLSDGSIAVVAHRPAGTVVTLLAGSRERLVFDLGLAAVNATVDADATTVAWESGSRIRLLDLPSRAIRTLVPGSAPQLAPDGTSILVADDGGSRLLDMDGSVLATFDGPVGFEICGGCRP